MSQVYALDKRYVDPRRPHRAKLTPEEVEERLMPYNELIAMLPLSYATQVRGVRTRQGSRPLGGGGSRPRGGRGSRPLGGGSRPLGGKK